MVKQFAKLGVQLEIRATDYNQFQDKMLKGKQQIFWWGWLADYPDAENFLFLLYGPNAKFPHAGREHRRTTASPEYDRLYRIMQTLEDGPEKQKTIDQMVAIVREDSHRGPGATGPMWRWPSSPGLHNGKPSILVRDLAEVLPHRPGHARGQAGRMEPPGALAAGADRCWPLCWLLAWVALARLPRAAARHGPGAERTPEAQ